MNLYFTALFSLYLVYIFLRHYVCAYGGFNYGWYGLRGAEGGAGHPCT